MEARPVASLLARIFNILGSISSRKLDDIRTLLTYLETAKLIQK